MRGAQSQQGREWFEVRFSIQPARARTRAVCCDGAGSEPLLYVTVLLLSLQFRAVVDFLAQDPGSTAYRVDAVHLGIALLHHQLLDVSGADAGKRAMVMLTSVACSEPRIAPFMFW